MAYEYVVIAIVILVALAALVFIVYLVARAVTKARGTSNDDVDEERESLDARSILRQQLRALLDGLRAPRSEPERDELQPGSARWLYREMLRAGGRVGIVRHAAETADEYVVRLASALRASGENEAEALAVTQAYDGARYGSSADDLPASPEVAAQAQAALTHIRAIDRSNGG